MPKKLILFALALLVAAPLLTAGVHNDYPRSGIPGIAGDNVPEGIVTLRGAVSDTAFTADAKQCFTMNDTRTGAFGCGLSTSPIRQADAQLAGGYTYKPLTFTVTALAALDEDIERCNVVVYFAQPGEDAFPNQFTGAISTGVGNDVSAIYSTKTIPITGPDIVGAGFVTPGTSTTIPANSTECSRLEDLMLTVTMEMYLN